MKTLNEEQQEAYIQDITGRYSEFANQLKNLMKEYGVVDFRIKESLEWGSSLKFNDETKETFPPGAILEIKFESLKELFQTTKECECSCDDCQAEEK